MDQTPQDTTAAADEHQPESHDKVSSNPADHPSTTPAPPNTDHDASTAAALAAAAAAAATQDGVIRTLDGELAGDEFASDALNYRILLAKIDALLDELKLDA